MSVTFSPARGVLAELDLLRIEQADAVLHVRLNRPAKRNALNDTLVAQLQTTFTNLPAETRVVVRLTPTKVIEHIAPQSKQSEQSEKTDA